VPELTIPEPPEAPLAPAAEPLDPDDIEPLEPAEPPDPFEPLPAVALPLEPPDALPPLLALWPEPPIALAPLLPIALVEPETWLAPDAAAFEPPEPVPLGLVEPEPPLDAPCGFASPVPHAASEHMTRVAIRSRERRRSDSWVSRTATPSKGNVGEPVCT
jgi:hypothetical protein